jgi:hypothetical protein
MGRKSIFEILESKFNFENEAKRLIYMFEIEDILEIGSNTFTLKDFIDEFCFWDWKCRGHCLDIDDFLSTIDYKSIESESKCNLEGFLTLIELIYNFYKIAGIFIEREGERYNICLYVEYDHLQTLIDDNLLKYNHKAYYNPETEQLLVIEDKPEVTAVAEIIEEPLTLPVIRYNHHSMKGDLSAKKDILLKLGSYLEGKRDEVKAANSKLESNIFFMLNSLNLRHNNCDPSNKGKYNQAVAEMKDKTLEEWYDELYQMILLVILEMDNKERMIKIDGLKKAITGGR